MPASLARCKAVAEALALSGEITMASTPRAIYDIGVDELNLLVRLIRAIGQQQFDARFVGRVLHPKLNQPKELVLLKDDPGDLELFLCWCFLLIAAA